MGVKFDAYFNLLQYEIKLEPSKLNRYSIIISTLELLTDNEIALLESGTSPTNERCQELASLVGCDLKECLEVFQNFFRFFRREGLRLKPD